MKSILKHVRLRVGYGMEQWPFCYLCELYDDDGQVGGYDLWEVEFNYMDIHGANHN